MWDISNVFKRFDGLSLTKTREFLNTYSPYKFNNDGHLVTSLIVIFSLLDYLTSSLFRSGKWKRKQVRKRHPFVNEYDLAKALGLILMIIDHRAYYSISTVFGEYLTWNQKD